MSKFYYYLVIKGERFIKGVKAIINEKQPETSIGEVVLMQIRKKRIKKEDGRYLIYYTFTEEEKEGKDVRVEM